MMPWPNWPYIHWRKTLLTLYKLRNEGSFLHPLRICQKPGREENGNASKDLPAIFDQSIGFSCGLYALITLNFIDAVNTFHLKESYLNGFYVFLLLGLQRSWIWVPASIHRSSVHRHTGVLNSSAALFYYLSCFL